MKTSEFRLTRTVALWYGGGRIAYKKQSCRDTERLGKCRRAGARSLESKMQHSPVRKVCACLSSSYGSCVELVNEHTYFRSGVDMTYRYSLRRRPGRFPYIRLPPRAARTTVTAPLRTGALYVEFGPPVPRAVQWYTTASSSLSCESSCGVASDPGVFPLFQWARQIRRSRSITPRRSQPCTVFGGSRQRRIPSVHGHGRWRGGGLCRLVTCLRFQGRARN